ncbi:MAG: nucleotidyltransferase family protein [Gracilimonas sp.]|jgi:predicted nucleotidyltransferase|nr:nucleotidyltransferase family protein [Gracilimonas sp.]
MITKEQQKIIIEKSKPFEPSKIGIFGSYARNEQSKDSDLDVLVNFRKRVNLLELVGLEQELSEMLGVKVDLVTEKSINKNLREYILKDLKVILDD